MQIVTNHAVRLIAVGFTTTQAAAIDAAVHASAGEAVDALGEQLRRWHVYLTFYLLIQIGIVLLAVLMLQAVREPVAPYKATVAAHPGQSAAALRADVKW